MYLDWQTNGLDYYAVDIETDALNATKIWCMCWEDIRTGEKGTCRGVEEIRQWFEGVPLAVFVGHNSIAFDFYVLRFLAGVRVGVDNGADTMVLSQLYSPSLETGHSLESWGQVLRRPKVAFSDFSRLSDDMVTYCQQDVSITAELFRRLTKVLSKISFSERSIRTQHHWWGILDQQHRRGFAFDEARAVALLGQIRSLEEKLKDQVRVVFPSQQRLVRTARTHTGTGKLASIYDKDRARYRIEKTDDGRYEAFEAVDFNLGSPSQRVEKLTQLGWKPWPNEVTPKGTPTPFIKGKLAPSLEKFLEDNNIPEVEYIARCMSYNGRANMISTWLDESQDGYIHGKLFVANTLRLRHRSPNTSNIPAVRTTNSGTILLGESGYFTYEARDLWVARPGRVLVGTDAAGLELRMSAHELNNPEFTKQVIDGDPHQYNADLVYITRPQAKTVIYAVQYGASGKKIAATLGVSQDEGVEIRQTFLDRLGLTNVIKEAENEQRTGRVSLVDGSKVICPSPHAAFNYKLQGGGARVMAMANIMLEEYIRQDGLDALKVGDIHDEWQYDVAPMDASRHGERAVQAIREAGEELNLNVPLDGSSKVGKTWAETH